MRDEQRKTPRYSVEVAAEVEVDGEVLVASTLNLSRGGVGLVLDRPIDEGTRVGVMLFLTQDGIEDPDEEPFEAPGLVAWGAEQEPGRFVAGVRFESVSPPQAAQLERFLAAIGE